MNQELAIGTVCNMPLRAIMYSVCPNHGLEEYVLVSNLFMFSPN